MENESIIDQLFEIRDDDLYAFKDENFKKLDKEISINREKLENFISKRVHPKSRNKLNELISNLENAIDDVSLEREKLYYKAGISDCVNFILSAISCK